MPLSKKFKLVFIHIPKNAGTSIFHILYKHDPDLMLSCVAKKSIPNRNICVNNDYHLSHYSYDEILQISQKIDIDLQDYHFFAIVRNPYYKFLSALAHPNILQKNSTVEFLNTVLDILIEKKYSIETLGCVGCKGVQCIIFYIQGKRYFLENKHFMTQSFYLYDHERQIDPKIKILRFENIENEFVEYANQYLQLSVSIPKSNSGKIQEYDKFLTDEIKDKIYKIYEEDFINFHYDK